MNAARLGRNQTGARDVPARSRCDGSRTVGSNLVSVVFETAAAGDRLDSARVAVPGRWVHSDF